MLFFSVFLEAKLIVPNGEILPYKMDGDVKVFQLIAEPIMHELAPGLVIHAWGFNGRTPGPVIEAYEGDKLRIYVTNYLPEYTSIHWHGIILPNGMDGVNALTQPPILPGETFVYEFTLVQNGTFMYHPHADDVAQIGMGLMGFFIIHPKEQEDPSIVRDFCIMTQEWKIPTGANAPEWAADQFNYFTFNGKVFPATESLVAKKGDRVRIRWGNLSMHNHPLHLHGYEFTITRMGGKRLAMSAQWSAVTVDVPVGDTREIEFVANNLGDWALHCHKVHHLMNGMMHGLPNMMNVKLSKETIAKIRKHLPEFMPMGLAGMGSMFTGKPIKNGPSHFLPYGAQGPFGIIDMGGMFTVFKVREEINDCEEVGWYHHPFGTTAHKVKLTNKNKRGS